MCSRRNLSFFTGEPIPKPSDGLHFRVSYDDIVFMPRILTRLLQCWMRPSEATVESQQKGKLAVFV
jgi:hypothetical protein